jgi:hypothetical protein
MFSVEVEMTVNQAYWWLMSFMVMLLGFILMLGNLYSYPGSLFWGEAWIYAGATLFAGGAISWIVIDAATFAVKGE